MHYTHEIWKLHDLSTNTKISLRYKWGTQMNFHAVSTSSFLHSTWRSEISFILWPPFPLGKELSQYPLKHDPELFWMWGRRQKFPTTAKNEPYRLKTAEMCLIF
jgi:hypothetical protein